MRQKILSTFSFILLSALSFYFLVKPTVVIKVDTDAPKKKITLEYKNDDGILAKIQTVTMFNGKAEFSIPTKTLKSFQIFVPSPHKLESVVIKSNKRQKLDIPASYKFTNLNINGTLLQGLRFFLWAEFLLAVACLMIPYLAVHGAFKIPPADNKKLLNIEFLRILFTLGIVCCHFFPNLGIKNFGGIGVEFFFILSGYFLSLTFRNDLSTPDFIKKKVIAWLPLIMFGSILCGGYFSCFKDIFFLQSTGLAYPEITNAPAWFLGVLMWVLVFYFYMLKSLPRPQCNLIIGVISFCSYVLCAQNNDLRTTMIFSYFPLSLFQGLAGVGAGYLLAQFCSRSNTQEKLKHFKLWSALEIFALVWVFSRLFITQIPVEWIFSPISFILIIYLFIKKQGLLTDILEHPFWNMSARYCLAVYLTHASIIGVFEKYGSLYNDWILNNRITTIIIVLTSCIILGIFSYHAIQKPAEKFLKEHWR